MPENIQATLLELTAITVMDAIPDEASEINICGGGAYNGALLNRLTELAKNRVVQSTSAYGVPPNQIETTAFAWMARRTLLGKTANLSSVTGAVGDRILGGIYLP